MNSIEPQSAAPLLPRHVSPWTTQQKIYRLFWGTIRGTLFRFSFHNWYPWRAALLRAFGAKIGKNVRIRRSVVIEIPSNLTIGDDVQIGDAAILYALGPITIGDRALISQYAHLCAGSHDYHRKEYPLLRPPITIGSDCWIAADAFIGPDVTIGDRSIVGARASVFASVPPDIIVAGNPAKFLKPRDPIL
jgi:putative colanic acid biosynthesis acetyltransferase WcaF